MQITGCFARGAIDVYRFRSTTKTFSFTSWIYISVRCKRDFSVYHIQDMVSQEAFSNNCVIYAIKKWLCW